jgi:3-deoxy-7-phosphoheptulonate synthase
MQQTQNLYVEQTVPLIPPRQLMAELPMTNRANNTVVAGREQIKRILSGEDQRLLVVVGPCSIHDPVSAMEYANKLAVVAEEVRQRMFLVMRVYFEKPRTTVGWKGLINDPHMNDTFDMGEGLRRARKLLLEVGELGLPAATEMLEPITPQYIADLVSFTAIGARTTESPTHRQMASGLSMPVGYKNGTDGNLQVALDAMLSARTPHRFLGIDANGSTCIVYTRGNPWGILVLRGGRAGSNYSPEDLDQAAASLTRMNLPSRIMVDCSHANSGKDHRKQGEVWHAVLDRRAEDRSFIAGMMLESNLFEGSQKLTSDPSKLQYGVSVTDSCIGWEETEKLIRSAADRLRQ